MKMLLQMQASIAVVLLGVPSIAVAGGGGITAAGEMNLNLVFAYPPTPDELSRVEDSVQIASVILCDATEGKIRITKADITDSTAAQESADVLYVLQPGRSTAWGPNLGNLNQHVTLKLDSVGEGPTLAHELGHYLFGLGDSYDEQRRWGSAYGIGLAIDFSEQDAQDQSLMQTSGVARCGTFTAACRDATYAANDCFSASGSVCRKQTDCAAGQDCYFDYGTEFTVAANHDLNNGITDVGYPTAAATSRVTSAVFVDKASAVKALDTSSLAKAKASAAAWNRVELTDSIGKVHWEMPGLTLDDEKLGPYLEGNYSDGSVVLWSFLEHYAADAYRVHFGIDDRQLAMPPASDSPVLDIIETVDVTMGAGCGDGTVQGALGEECEAGQSISCATLTGDAGATGSALCRPASCTWQRTSCSYPALLGFSPCNNALINTSEQCEGAPRTTCASYGSSGGSMACTNCMNDPGNCTHPSSVPSVTTPNPRIVAASLVTGAADINVPLTVTVGAGASSVLMTADGTGECTQFESLVNCDRSYSGTSSRFETSNHTLTYAPPGCVGAACIRSEWAVLVDNFKTSLPSISAPAGKPVAAIPAVCRPTDAAGNWNPVAITRNFDGADQIMVVLDRSGSMDTKVGGGEEKRIDYAREAIRALLDLREGSTLELGLLSFNDTTTLHQPIKPLDKAHRTAIETDVTMLAPAGNTAVGQAMVDTIPAFDAASATAQHRLVYLVSDGYHNTGLDPASAKAQLKAYVPGPVRVFTVPVSQDADRVALGDISGSLGGSMLDAPTGDELIPVFAELAARSKGGAVILPRRPSSVTDGNCDSETRNCELVDTEALRPQDTFTFLVEQDAGALELTLSSRNELASTWRPEFQLTAPDGTVYGLGSSQVLKREYYTLIRIPRPVPGDWSLSMMSSSGPQLSYVVGTVANPVPRCAVSVTPARTTGGPVTLKVTPSSYNAFMPDTVEAFAVVIEPNGASTLVTLTGDRNNGSFSGDYLPTMRGAHTVLGACSTDDQSVLMPGDTITAEYDVPQTAPPFQRLSTVTFFSDTSSLAPCSRSDCDGDGILNDVEGNGDTDGDGFPDSRDTDSNNDDVPDSVAGNGDMDGDGTPNSKDLDIDGDSLPNTADNCPIAINADQTDSDGDGRGDACDDDRDNDGIPDAIDTCPEQYNPTQNTDCRAAPQVDFDGDGQPDIVWRSCLISDTSIWLTHDRQFEVVPTTRSQNLGFYVVGTGDFTGDGKPDLLWQNTLLGNTRIWRMNGMSFAAEQNGPSVPLLWAAVAVTDFDGDGKADIVIRNSVTGENRIWLMNGTTRRSTVNLPSTLPVLGDRLAGAGDLDGDGHVDLLWHSILTGQLTLWRMQGTTRIGTTTFGGPLLELEFYVGAIDDFDGDGHNDILWHNSLLTEALVWRMNGATKLGEYRIAAPAALPGIPLSVPPGVLANASGGGLCGL
jgi:hypothetical protein